jgi:hypothetical protein
VPVAIPLDANWELVGEAPDGLARRLAEHEPWILVVSECVPKPLPEVVSLVVL